MISILEIKQLILPLHIGVTKEERAILQDIEFNITINFYTILNACESDQIDDALCYDNLTQEIKEFCKKNEFHLIEHLSFVLHRYIRENYLNSQDKLTLQICKFAPVKEIKGQCCFTIND